MFDLECEDISRGFTVKKNEQELHIIFKADLWQEWASVKKGNKLAPLFPQNIENCQAGMI